MSRTRRWLAIVVVLTGGTAFQLFPSSCGEYGVLLGLTAFDACSVLNCQNATYFNLCEPVRILTDCPQPAGNP